MITSFIEVLNDGTRVKHKVAHTKDVNNNETVNNIYQEYFSEKHNYNYINTGMRKKGWGEPIVNTETIARHLKESYFVTSNGKQFYFRGDTYNNKNKIKTFAKKYNLNAKYLEEEWEIDAESLCKIKYLNKYISFLQDLMKKFNCFSSTSRRLEDVIEFLKKRYHENIL
ncbi:MAG: hypothetical protein ACOCQR_00305 [bacterium]